MDIFIIVVIMKMFVSTMVWATTCVIVYTKSKDWLFSEQGSGDVKRWRSRQAGPRAFLFLLVGFEEDGSTSVVICDLSGRRRRIYSISASSSCRTAGGVWFLRMNERIHHLSLVLVGSKIHLDALVVSDVPTMRSTSSS
jgi:hypothetical protein